MISCDELTRLVQEAGRSSTGGREEMTIREVFEAYGGRGSGATARMARELDVTQRQVQRMVTEHGTEKRGMGPKSMRYFREMSGRELQRAGARFIRENGLTIDGEFALCYGREQQGDDRELRGGLTIDNDEWLDVFEEGDCQAAARMFTDLMLSEYGVDAGDLDVCDEDSGENLHAVT